MPGIHRVIHIIHVCLYWWNVGTCLFKSWKDEHDVFFFFFIQNTAHGKCQKCQVGQPDFGGKHATSLTSGVRINCVLCVGSVFHFGVFLKDGQSYLGLSATSPPWHFCAFHCQIRALSTVSYPPVLLPGLQGGACSRNLVLCCCCFYTLFPALKKKERKKSQICCLSVFKIGGGRLGDCLCVVALVHSYVLYLKFSDDLQLVVTTRQSSLPNAVVRQSGERLASRLPV